MAKLQFICPLNQLFLHGYNSVFVMKILWFSVFLGHHCWLSTASIYHNTKELSSESELSCSGPAGAHLLPSHPPALHVTDSDGLLMAKTM